MKLQNTWDLGPLHTRATSRDHEIVRAQRKGPKAVPTHIQNHVVWSRALNQMLYQWNSIHAGSRTW